MPVRLVIPSFDAIASSSASSGTRSWVRRHTGDEGRPHPPVRLQLEMILRRARPVTSVSSGCATTAASASRSSLRPASRSFCGCPDPGSRQGAPSRRDPRERLARQVEPVGDEAQRLLALGRVFGLGENLTGAHESLLPVARSIQLESHAVVEVALRLRRAAARIRSDCRRDPGPRGSTTMRISKPCACARSMPRKRRILPGCIGVEAEIHALRQPGELTKMMLGQGRAHRRDDGLEPCLAQGDHVGVALDHDGAVLLRDRRPGEVEPVENVALLEQLALRRVDVLPLQRVVVVQLARLEADHPASGIGEREHQPRREVVVASLVGEPGCTQLLGGEPLLTRLARRARCPARARGGTPSRLPHRARDSRGTRARARPSAPSQR